MKIDFEETTDDLAKRINIHEQYGSRDIDAWMLDVLQLQPDSKILDIGCGAGKQCFSYFHYLNSDADITGTDVSRNLLNEAIEKNKQTHNAIKFQLMDFNLPFLMASNQYDLVSACFAIYYAQDIPWTLAEMHRVLKPGGRLFTTGPMPSNKQLFYDIIKEATGKAIPPMPGSSRYEPQIYPTMQSLFSKAEQHIFENPLTFTSVEPFMVYTRASMSEDRKLWNTLLNTHEEFEQVMQAIQQVAQKRLAKDGVLVMTKVVGGFLATK